MLVTGASGFLGRHVSRVAARQGFAVTGIGHGAWSGAEAAGWGVTRWRQGEVTTEGLARLEMTPEVVVHCAGSGTAATAFHEPAQDFVRSVGATVEVLEFIRVHSPNSALVYPSSGAVYGRPAQMPVPETAPAAPVNPYGVHKWVAETTVESYARHFGVRAAIVRIFSLYGSELRKQLLWDACIKAQQGDFVFEGTGEETRDWVSVEDAAALILLAASHASPEAPVVNCAAGEELRMREVLAQVLAALGTAEHPRFTGNRREGDLVRYAGDPARALAWGWTPRQDWRTGMAEYAAWFLASGGR
ncbi:MAG: NAD(P)-dependent oxidoreductase [Thermomicrobiales bacterium]